MENQITVKFDDLVNEQIGQLAEQFDCSRAEAVRRAIGITSRGQIGTPTNIESLAEMQNIMGEILGLIQTLLAVHQKHHTATLATLRMTGQAGLCSAVVADKYGLLVEAQKQHKSWLAQNVGQHYLEDK